MNFMNKIKNIKPLYTQVLNGFRVKEHDVTYVFDEVGCGKTVSAIIAMASIIDEKETNKQDGEEVNYKILVLTPKSVCAQFEAEIKDKLNIDSLQVKNIAFLNNKELQNAIKEVKDNSQIIVISNPHKAEKLVEGIQWDLVIIDEAHDIVCNNQSQTANYYDYNKYDRKTKKYISFNRINDAYEQFCNDYNKCESMDEKIKKHFDGRKEYIKNNPAVAQFAKSIVVEEYNRYMGYGMLKIVENRRDIQNYIFRSICKIKTEKVMFMTATPYKYNKDFDFINYALVGTKMTTENGLLYNNNFPDLQWVNSLYTSCNPKNEQSNFINSNTSLMFKEITQAITLNDKPEEIKGKERKVEVWDENEESNYLHNKLLGDEGILKYSEESNRVIIFVSNSSEGSVIFKKIFPQAEYDIAQDNAHKYTDRCTNVSCEFIMNKFGNASNLNNYAKEINSNIKIPDILIVTWQVAQVGVNLPTYNYVINYHIPPVPGYLEQRYGRIDRLNSKNNPLYNIYYLDNEKSTQVYRANLIQALWIYKTEILDIPHNLPVKNLLICNELQVGELDCDKLYESLAYYIHGYIELNGGTNDVKNYLKSLNDNCKAFSIKYDDEKIIKIHFDNAKPDKEYCYTNYQKDDEINQNEIVKKEVDKENVKKQVDALINYINECEKMNEMVRKLNSDNIGQAGSIIFLDEQNKKAVVECKYIVENILKEKEEFFQNNQSYHSTNR